jgi:uncharacterized OB-fold protein
VAAPRFDLPAPDLETQPFWDAARDERLLMGAATLYTWSVVHVNDLPPFGERVPYVAAVVDLEEGPRMLTNVVDAEFDSLAIGMRLMVAFRDISDEVSIPVFRPA